jgi:glutamyl-tRNA reductase
VLETLYTFAFTHRNLDLDQVGLLHIEATEQKSRLVSVKVNFGCKELMYLSTCNRVEFTIVSDQKPSIGDFIKSLYPEINQEDQLKLASNADVYAHEDAVKHLLYVASSIDSMIVGEREIITQVRNSFETSRANGLTGDFIRLLVKKAIETAKKVYTETNISKKPISVVSLAYQKLKSLNISLDSRFLIVGAGLTNTTMCKFLKKHGFSNFVVFNRSFENGKNLALELEATSHSLGELSHYKKGFDVLITCTGANAPIIDLPIYNNLLNGEENRKTIIDIAIQDFADLTKERNVELAMKEVPEQVKEIRRAAMSEVFKQDIENMDPETREVLDKVLGYVEKKYISGPMKLAKEIILKKNI